MLCSLPPRATPAQQPHAAGSLSAFLRADQGQQRRGVAAAAGRAPGGRDTRADRYAAVRTPSAPMEGPADSHSPPPAHEPVQSSGGVPPVAPVEPSVLASRRGLRRLLLVQHFRAVGVSFEGRQALIAQLRRGQALALVREADNPHDPHAVAIRTLADCAVGYIARDKTNHFPQDLCFGAVGSVGQQGEQGLWGLTVLVQPTIPPVEVYAFPANLAPYVKLGLHLAPSGGDAWAVLKSATLAAAQGRCEVTAAPLAAVHERWQFDDEQRVLRLLGFRAEAPEVQQIGGLLELDPQSAAGLTMLLQQLNGWTSEDTQLYLEHARQLRQQRSTEQWRLDLGLLAAHNISIPPELQPLCV